MILLLLERKSEVSNPGVSVIKNDDGTFTAVSTSHHGELAAVNWANVFQAVLAAIPAILQILAAFSAAPLPTPNPTPAPVPTPPPVASP